MNPSQNEPTPEELELLRRSQQAEEEKWHYAPRPKWQIVGAWILIAILVLGIINVCYWQIHGIPAFLQR